MSKGTSTLEIYIENAEVKDNSAYLLVTYSEWWDKGVWTFSNGDPGYPPSYDLEIDKYEVIDSEGDITWITDEIIYEKLEEKIKSNNNFNKQF
jgi:hypothetical protein